jgi:hypothetical protein
MLDLGWNRGLAVLPAGMWSLTRLEELNMQRCGLTALPEDIVGLAGLRALDRGY